MDGDQFGNGQAQEPVQSTEENPYNHPYTYIEPWMGNNQGVGYRVQGNVQDPYPPAVGAGAPQSFYGQPGTNPYAQTSYGQPGTNPYARYYQPTKVSQNSGNGAMGMAVAGMVCGILSLVTCFFGFFLAIPGLVLSIIALRNAQGGGRGMAIAGIICSALGLVMLPVLVILMNM